MRCILKNPELKVDMQVKYCKQLAIEHGLVCCDSARDMIREYRPEIVRAHGGSHVA